VKLTRDWLNLNRIVKCKLLILPVKTCIALNLHKNVKMHNEKCTKNNVHQHEKMHARYWTGFILGIIVPTEKTDEIEQMDVHTKIKCNDQSDHDQSRSTDDQPMRIEKKSICSKSSFCCTISCHEIPKNSKDKFKSLFPMLACISTHA